MTRPAIIAEELTGFKEIVRLLGTHRISALPVVDDDCRVIGVVSEADLLLKEELPDFGGKPPIIEPKRRSLERTKSTALMARDVMTAPAVTVGPEETLAAAARLIHQKAVKRLPVVDGEGRILGVVSRGDLLKVFLRPDAEIWQEVVEGVILQTLWMDPAPVHVDVTDGVVTLQGQVDRRSDIPLLVGFIHGVDGVVGVEESLTFRFDDVAGRLKVPAFGSVPLMR